jgi:ketosteroid isomerase-like protein
MTEEEENEETVRAAYAAYLRADLAAVLNICSEDTEWRACGPPERLPYAGLHSGRAAVARYFAILDDAEESDNLVPREFITTSDRVIVFGEYSARVNANGRRFATEFVHIFTLRDGRIIKFCDYYDTARAVEAYEGVDIGTSIIAASRAGLLGSH